MKSILRPALVLLALLTLLTGVLYPLLVTGLAQSLFPSQSNGSLIEVKKKPVGSRLIGQSFQDPKYFWGRPSATMPNPYNASSSSGSNLGPTNPALRDAIQQRIRAIKALDPTNTKPIPIDLVTASGSGLDPHISPAAALYQVSRIARVRSLSEIQVRALVEQYTEHRTLGILGEPRVNVLMLNIALEQVTSALKLTNG